jgi:hypothetical protein
MPGSAPRPHAVGHGLVVRVAQQGVAPAVAREVDLAHVPGRDAVEPGERVEAVAGGAHVHVVYVQQQAAARALAHAGDAFPCRHRRVGKGQVARWILEQQRASRRILGMKELFCSGIELKCACPDRRQAKSTRKFKHASR